MFVESRAFYFHHHPPPQATFMEKIKLLSVIKAFQMLKMATNASIDCLSRNFQCNLVLPSDMDPVAEDVPASTKPETKTENKPETETENKPETETENEPETEIENKPETKIENKPETKIEKQSENKPETKIEKQSETKRTLTDREIQQFFLQKYFISNPLNEEEETLTEIELHQLIKCYYKKCNELEEIITENSAMVQHARQKYKWTRVLEGNLTIEDLTYVATTFLIEYEMSENDKEKPTATCEIDPSGSKTTVDDKKETLDQSINAGVPDHDKTQKPAAELQDPICYKMKEICIENLLGHYYHARLIERNLVRNLKLRKAKEEADAKETEGTNKDEKSEDEKLVTASLSEKVDTPISPAEKLSADRLEFIRTYKKMIRAALMLFKRVNPAWMKLAEEVVEKFDSQEKKRKELSKSKSISVESSRIPSSVDSSSSGFSVLSKQETSDQSSKESMKIDPEEQFENFKNG